MLILRALMDASLLAEMDRLPKERHIIIDAILDESTQMCQVRMFLHGFGYGQSTLCHTHDWLSQSYY